jgi:RNA polymerase sigma-70 factor (ECF subfamily)
MAKINEQSFLEAYDAYADAIFRHCYFRVYDREQARDLVQETFIRTWEYLAKGEEVENIRAFLYRVANNLVIDHARKKKSVSLDMLEEQGFNPSVNPQERLERTLDAQFVLQVLQELDAEYRQVVIMRYIDDLGPKDIAVALGESENVVSVRLHRALAKLRKLLSKYE